MKSTRPISLLDRITSHENERHARRLFEIKQMATKLAMFEPIFRALEERRCPIPLDGVRLCGKELSLSGGGLPEWDTKRYDALIDLGFIELDRSGMHYAIVNLKKGRLLVSIMIPASHKAASTAAAAQ